jgi:glycine dehydrogenase subunit 1
MPSFLGAGIYHHYIPAIVGHLLARGEFQTSYTPYQPEVSQGVLQCAYEFQSMVCQLTGMDVANASMYDAATGLAEAALMAADLTERKRIVVTPGVHPEYRDVIRTYTLGQDLVTIAAQPDEQADGGQLATELLDESIAALLIQHPNFFGCLEDVGTLAAKAHEVGALAVVAVDPIALGLLRSPGACGADIVVADGQSLGNAPSFGGPTAGIFACRQRFLRRLPGRLVGATTDSEENRGYVLTLQTREQHIRRERATSNICTNEALNALAATIYLSTLGAQGLRQIAELCVQKAHYAATAITSLPGFTLRFDRPFFKEFVVRCPVSPSLVNDALLEHGIIGGYDLGRAFPLLADSMLFCVTEMNTRYDIDRMVGILREL